MGSESRDKSISLVNTSGFPFQIAVLNYIERTKNSHGWRVFSSETPWQNPNTSSGGYVDLILIDRHETQLMIVECKRVRNARWIFLPTSDKFQRTYAKCWISYLEGQKEKLGWYDLTLDPSSPEANFCVIRGQDKDSKPMLERIASELVEATESIALEEMQLIKLNNISRFRRFYWPVIITTAQIEVCVFNPDTDIKIENGEVSDAEFNKVPLLRFTKSLSTRLSNNIIPKNFARASEEKKRTVFVMNVSKLVEILKEWDINSGPWGNW
jgi:hypothetical protein